MVHKVFTLHKVPALVFWRFAHTRLKHPLGTIQSIRTATARATTSGKRKAGGAVMGIEGLLALVAFATVGFIWAIAPEKAES